MGAIYYCTKCKRTFTEGDVIASVLPPKCPHCGSRKIISLLVKQIMKKIIDILILKYPYI